jgi:hypothetical protein
VNDETTTAWYGGHVADEQVIKLTSREMSSQCKVQRSLNLTTQLACLVFCLPVTVLLAIGILLQGSLEFRINQIKCDISLANALGHDNSLPRAHAMTRAPARQTCARRRKSRQLVDVESCGSRSCGPDELPG